MALLSSEAYSYAKHINVLGTRSKPVALLPGESYSYAKHINVLGTRTKSAILQPGEVIISCKSLKDLENKGLLKFLPEPFCRLRRLHQWILQIASKNGTLFSRLFRDCCDRMGTKIKQLCEWLGRPA